jgi:nucleosome assembly protein 1-like 1
VAPTAEEAAAAPKGIPGFWLTALGNHLGISELITERDEAALKHLTDIKVSYLEGRPGFRLTFEFGPGAKEFFENETLEKTYYYQDEVGYGGDFVYEKAEGTDIKWKEGKDLTTKVETKKQRNKNTNQTRVVKKVVPTDSFFAFFKPPVAPGPDEGVDEDEEDDIEEKLELDYQIGEDLKERIVPRAVDFFTGKALRLESGADDDLSDEFDEFEDDDEDDDDDEDAGVGVPGAQKRRKAPVPPSGVTPVSNQDPQECKQQ